MRALIFQEHGTLDNVILGEMPRPVPGRGQLLVNLKASALNRLDLWVLEGWRGLNLHLPHIMGCDGAGIVAEVGDEVTCFSPGDRVAINPTRSCGRCRYCLSGRHHMCQHFAIYGEHVPGFFADYQIIQARNALQMPDHISFEVAAAASLVYVTAWQSLVEVARLRPGEDILIVGAGGGVNTACIDVARLVGARSIYVVGSSDEKLERARAFGAHVTVNRLKEEWRKAVYERSGREGVDVVVDNVGAATFQQSLRSLRKGGRLVTVGNTSGPFLEIDNRYIFSRHLQILGSSMGSNASYEAVMDLVFGQRLGPQISEVLPLEEGREALQKLAGGQVFGKLVLQHG
jgi:NADPH:quinone reductase-like Zn-dependent oxidoreductase